MRQLAPERVEYSKLKEDILGCLADNTDVTGVKKEFRLLISSKRKFERINSIRTLFQELERQLLIFPEKKGIQYFYSIVQQLNSQQSGVISQQLLDQVDELHRRLQPVLESPPLPSALPRQTSFQRVPENVRLILAKDLKLCGGKDWEHFAMGLGTGLGDKEDILKLKLGKIGEFEEKHNGDIKKILDDVLTHFEDNCLKSSVTIDMLKHISKVLKNVDIFTTPLNLTANKIKREREKLKSIN